MPELSHRTKSNVLVWTVLKWLCLALVLCFISRRAWQLWGSTPKEEILLEWPWLVLAGIVYLISWLPCVWLWRALLRNLEQPLGAWDAIRAYYIGHLGKYVPGKALVLFIRASLVKDQGVDPILAGCAVVYETLVFMSTGAAIGLSCAPFALGDTFWKLLPASLQGMREYQHWWPLVVIGLTFATTPLSAAVFSQICHLMAPRDPAQQSRHPEISAILLCQGIAVTAVGWLVQSISLGLVLRALVRQSFAMNEFPVWLASTTLSNVLGFVVLIAPGGVGVREGLMIETLKDVPQIGAQGALIAAALHRAVSFLAEVLLAATLFIANKLIRRPPRNSDNPPES